MVYGLFFIVSCTSTKDTSNVNRCLAIGFLLLTCLCIPEGVEACSSCFSGEETRATYIGTTVFLSLLPIAIIVGMGIAVRRRYVDPENQAAGRS